MRKLASALLITSIAPMLLAACQSNFDQDATDSISVATQNNNIENPGGSDNYDDLEIITLLPRDAIPAIDNPKFLSPSDAESEYAPDELILGVVLNGEARAYSVNLLSSHEIVNDTVGGAKISVTW